MKSILITQTDILLKNVEETLAAINKEQLYDEEICDWPLEQQVYHLLHSLDQWFINPRNYEEPTFGGLEAIPPASGTDRRLSKVELVEYFTSIKAKINEYLETLDTDGLNKHPENCEFTRLDLILGQFRHAMYHVGLIHGCLQVATGKSPRYTGLGSPIRSSEQSS